MGNAGDGESMEDEDPDRQADEAGERFADMSEQERAQWEAEGRWDVGYFDEDEDDPGADAEGGAVASSVTRRRQRYPRVPLRPMSAESRSATFYPSDGAYGSIQLNGVEWPANLFWAAVHRILWRQRNRSDPTGYERDPQLENFDEEDMDLAYHGVWFRGRFYAGGTFYGPKPGVTWEYVRKALDANPYAPGEYASAYPEQFVESMGTADDMVSDT